MAPVLGIGGDERLRTYGAANFASMTEQRGENTKSRPPISGL